jgi:hypothetical protein
MEDDDMIVTKDGRWTKAAVKKYRPLVAGATWHKLKSLWVLSNGDTTLASVRRTFNKPFQYIVHVYGHEYRVTRNMRAAKNGWPVGTYISVQVFLSLQDAKDEVKRVLQGMEPK